MQAAVYICTATCFMPRYYPKPTGYMHVAVCCIGRYQGSIKALLSLYSGPIKALFRLFYSAITAVLRHYSAAIIHICVYTCVCVCMCVCNEAADERHMKMSVACVSYTRLAAPCAYTHTHTPC